MCSLCQRNFYSDVGDYRPILIPQISSKVFEKIVAAWEVESFFG